MTERDKLHVNDEMLALAGDFPSVDEQAWRSAVDCVLARSGKELSAEEREALFQRSMTSKTCDDIIIKALYTERDAPSVSLGVPGFPPFIRGATVAGRIESGWDVRQRVELGGDGSETALSILAELENGTTSIWLGLSEKPTAEALDRAFQDVRLDLAPIILDAGKLDPGSQSVSAAQELIRLWNDREFAPADARGSFGADPIGASASSGISSEAEQARNETVELARICTRLYPGVWTIVVDATRYHEAGASDAEELACATATGVEYLRWLTEAGLNVEAALPQLEFRFAATADQFMTMAKLRAARRLWNRIGEVIGAPPDTRGQRQHAVTSRAMMTRYDPWTNLLRTAVACSAAGVAGASAITVVPYDYASGITASKLGRRLARNTHTILIEEAHLARVIDPAGGSWYVEALSDELARAAWQWFAVIEGAGGMIEALSQRMVQERIARTWSRRLQNIVRRRDPITGVSEFPDISEQAQPIPFAPSYQSKRGDNALPVVRYAAPFEELRARAERAFYEGSTPPSIFLANLGPLSEHTARATFCKNLFESGGIRAIVSATVEPTTVARTFCQSQARLACVCGTGERYAAEAQAVVQELAMAGAARVYLAGDPGPLRDSLQSAGVDEFVVAGCNAVALLTGALAAAGVRLSGEAL